MKVSSASIKRDISLLITAYYIYGDTFEVPCDENLEVESVSDSDEWNYTLGLPLRLPCANHMLQNSLKTVLEGHLDKGDAFKAVKALVKAFRKSDASAMLHKSVRI